jgi:hypothetical protein
MRRQESLKKSGKHHEEKEKDSTKQGMDKLQCNKGKTCKFKRVYCSEEDIVAASAMLFLACVVYGSSI